MSAKAPTSALRTLNDIILLIAGREYRETLRHKRAGTWVSIEAGEMFRQVVWVTRGLERLGVVPGDRVALLSENRPEWAVADFSILGRGAVTVPIYPTLPAASCEYILQDSGACGIVVSNKAHLEKIRSVWDRLPQLRFAVAMEGVPVSAAPFRPFSDDADEKRQRAWRDLVGDAQLPSAERARFEVAGAGGGPGTAGQHHLHVRHHRHAQGGAAHPRQHRLERAGLGGSVSTRRSGPVLLAAVPHLRADGRLHLPVQRRPHCVRRKHRGGGAKPRGGAPDSARRRPEVF